MKNFHKDTEVFHRKSLLPAVTSCFSLVELLWDIYNITPRRRPEFSPAALVGPFIFWHACIVASAPGFWRKSCVGPLGLNPCAIPGTAVVQHEHQSALFAISIALHHVEVIVHVKEARGATGIFLMNLHQRGNAAWVCLPAQGSS